jgi:hypothetical protein
MKDGETCLKDRDRGQKKDSDNHHIDSSKQDEKPIRYQEVISDPYFMEKEMRVVRKLDLIVLCITMCHFFSALDKSNLGNAKTNGIEKELGMSPSQRGSIVSMTFVAFLLFRISVDMSLKYVGPKKLLSFCVFSFGIIALCCGIYSKLHFAYGSTCSNQEPRRGTLYAPRIALEFRISF